MNTTYENKSAEIICNSVLVARMATNRQVEMRQANGRIYFLSPLTGIHSIVYDGTIASYERAEMHWDGFKRNQN
jgi:hypothetical protein